MLELREIKKDYPAGSETVHALKGVDLQFRKNEFVSILGQSGCGKTTMLNIIGGLDQYTSGDLIINGRSTKDFKDRDWDTYRNHSIGFVFQSYNLIPHQSVLQNVEIALSLSGVNKAERRKRAIEALEQVGLGNQLKKKPGEMSGGQMQRVAIARALVNNPDIILADEPTGALDTETSVQVMDILKEVAKDRLVIMVTHNPDLANQYSSRIITMLDGKITSDSAPLSEEELSQMRKDNEERIEAQKAESKKERKKREKKPTLSWKTSFALSLKNLISKKGRTILTSFAGSIGIIGIALIFAVSNGMTEYIDMVQEETLSSYPLTLEANHVDMGTLLETFIGKAEASTDHDKDAVYQKAMIYEMLNALNTMEIKENDLASFKKYLEEEMSKDTEDNKLKEALNGVQYTYDMNMLVYTESADGEIIESDSQALLRELLLEYFGMDMSSMINMSENSSSQMSSMSSMGQVKLWQEMLAGEDGRLVNDLLDKQYDVIYGSWPTEYNEVVLVVDEFNEIDDMTLYALGLKTKEDINALADAAINKTELDIEVQKWSYEEICGKKYRVILGSNCYAYDEATGLYTDIRDSQAGMRYLYDNGIDIKVSGIIRPKEDALAPMLMGSIGYTSKLTEYIIENSKESDAVNKQLEQEGTDIFTGLPFKENTGNLKDEDKAEEFKKYVAKLGTKEKAALYVKIMCIPSDEEFNAMLESAMTGLTRQDMETTLISILTQQMGMGEDAVTEYLSPMSDEDIKAMYVQMISEQVKAQYASQVMTNLVTMTEEQLAGALDGAMAQYTNEQFGKYYDEALEFSDGTYEGNLKKLGYVNLDKPSTINLYASSFENKDVIEEVIVEYNEDVDELSEIAYTDYVGLMMSSVTSIINAITYVLIAFVAISLVVSSIMIGVITLISVQERTKEIGILRAIGASKKNVSGMFNAETMIIGFTSGLLGVVITYLLCIPINILLHHVTGIGNLNAILPLGVAITLVIISVLLTLISGVIPSRSAAKKDPVVALRTE